MPSNNPIYAVYAGEDYLCSGTALQLAMHFGVKYKTVKFWATPAYRRRMESVKRPSGHRRHAIKIEE